MQMKLGRVGLFLASAVLLGACGEDSAPEATELLVVIDADDAVRTQTTGLRVTIQSSPDRELTQLRDADEQRVDPGVDGAPSYPLTVAMRPGEGREGWYVVVTATATDATGDVTSARLVTSYVRGHVKYARVVLEHECIGHAVCAATETCSAGECVDAYVPVESLWDGHPGGVDASVPMGCGGSCDDGVYCNGEEICDPSDPEADDNGCVSVARSCDDSVECTADSCDETLRTCTHTPPDADGDGHADADCLDANGDALGDDCDDDNGDRFPGNPEVCSVDDSSATADEDCDPRTFGSIDLDGDGSIDARCCNTDADDVELCGLDCDDMDLSVHRRQIEFCDGKDNDCDDATDEVANEVSWYADGDGDGFGTGQDVVASCTPLDGRSLLATDCEDNDNAIHPASPETCDGLDNDCDGNTDERLSNCSSSPTVQPPPSINECLNGLDDCSPDARCTDTTGGFTCTCRATFVGTGHGPDGCSCTGINVPAWYADSDDDGFGDPGTVQYTCIQPDGYVTDNTDCLDSDENAHPGAADVLGDNRDSNCDGFEGDQSLHVFVAPGSAVDCAGTGASLDNPCLNLQAAITLAESSNPRKALIASVGTYSSDAALVLLNGVHIYGGYDFATGTRSTTNETVFRREGPGHHVASVGSQILSTTVVANVRIEATTPSDPGAGTYGLVCDTCSGLVLREVTIVAADGAAGVPGDPGNIGRNGGAGMSSRWYDTVPPPSAQRQGGYGGDPGGLYRGGHGGVALGCATPLPPGDRYYAGLPAPYGGGAGATAGGTPAVQGSDGLGATPAALGAVHEPSWLVVDNIQIWLDLGAGSDGSKGTPGRGGGGGRAFCDYGVLDSWFWNGASGGGAGDGGGPGSKGLAGGAAVGMVLRNSPAIVFDSVTLVVGSGGKGGDGGRGGDGGSGGPGGGPAPNAPAANPSAATGARGGSGGGGGGGGGGSGGASVNLVVDDATNTDLNTDGVTMGTLTGGPGGEGGEGGSSVNPGEAGLPGAVGIACDVFHADDTGAGTCL